jgi:PAS domain S-box-containing protein
LYDLAPVGYFTFDKNGVIVEANLTGCQMLGVERAYLLKKPFRLYISEDCQDRFYLHCRRVFETDTRQSCEISLVTKGGKRLEALLKSVRAANTEGNNALCHTTVTDITDRKQAEQKINEYQKHLKRLAEQLTLAEEGERRRIAGEIHDEISQTLTMAKIKLDALRNSPPSEWSSVEIKQISSYIENVIQETRTLTFELSNPILYELGFEAAAAEWLNDNVQEKHGVATKFQDDGRPKPLDDDLKVILFRNVRELLTNCIKHARAGKIRVSIRRIDDSIQVIVEDNGVGFDPAQVRTTAGKKVTFGLFSIRESMENTGGNFEIESRPGAGCKAIMTAPLKSSKTDNEM